MTGGGRGRRRGKKTKKKKTQGLLVKTKVSIIKHPGE
jgi:hypothetical protein